MTSNQQEAKEKRAQGITAYRAGNKEQARALFEEAVALNPMDEHSWLWLSGLVGTDEERRTCLEQVLTINPGNENAKKALTKLPPKPELVSLPTASPEVPFKTPPISSLKSEAVAPVPSPKPPKAPPKAGTKTAPTLPVSSVAPTVRPSPAPVVSAERSSAMDFADRIRELAARIPKQLAHIQTEEATKTSLVLPFITALGYNVFDPTEVTPELNADIGIKKGEKVDYAILMNGKPIMLWECKHHTANLSQEHASQLYRYFSVTDARFSILTNGLVYWFYTDLDAPNKMDAKPFFEFNILTARDHDIEALKKFAKSMFDIAGILSTASEMKYVREIKRILGEQLHLPSEEFVRFFVNQLQLGKLKPAVWEQFTQATQRALRGFITDQINARLQTALGPEVQVTPTVGNPMDGAPMQSEDRPLVETTPEEWEAFYIVKSILRDIVEPKRIFMRDVQTYCGVLLDDSNRRPVCRFWFNAAAQKYLGVFDEDKKEIRIPIQGLDDIYQHAEKIRATVEIYKKQKPPKED